MGKYQTTVAATTTNIYDIDTSSSKDLVAGLAFRHDHPHIPKILDSMYNSLALRIHQAYNYGRDEYTYGLPDGYREIIGDPNIDVIESALEEEVGYPVQVHYAVVEEPDDLFFAQKYAWEHWGFKQGTQVLHNSPVAPEQGYNVKFEDTVFDPYGNLLCTLNIGEEIIRDIPPRVKILTEDVLINQKALKPIPNQSKLYYHVRFTALGATTPNHSFWIYEVGSGKYPDLDDVQYDPLDSPYLPIIPLRQDNKNMGPEVKDGEYVLDDAGSRVKPDTELYRTSVTLCKKLGTDFDSLCKDISSNPDVGDIDHAYLIFGVDIRTTTPAGKAYLYDYFEDLALKFPGESSIVIQDAKYNVRINYSSNSRNVYRGSLDVPVELEYNDETLIIRKNLEGDTYGELVITELLHINYIYGNHAVKTTLSASADEDNHNFVIPVSIEVFTRTKGLFKRQDLLRESFKIVFNSYERRKLKWYERGWFKSILLIIAIVITVYSAGTLGSTIAGAYSAAGGGITAAITAAAKLIISAVVINAGVKWLASQLPPEIALIVAVVLTAVAISGGAGEFSYDFLDAEGMLGLTNSVIEGTQQGIQDELGELMSEMTSFMEEADAAQEELNDLIDSLDVSEDWFDQLIADKTDIVTIETPTEFYNRTIHAGNIGTATLYQIENYVDNSLELPELTQI